MSEMSLSMIFPAIIFTLAFLLMVTSTESKSQNNVFPFFGRADSGSTIANSIKDASIKKNIMRAGVNRGLKECRRLFKDEVWDCSFYNESVTGELPDFILTTLPYANKETAFLHAITTAGILQEILSKCDANKITECSCNKKRRQSRGCSEKLLFAEKMTLSLLATERQGNDERRTIDKDNKKVGIQVFKTNYNRNCLGRVTRNCYNFQDVANELKNKYHSAINKTNKAQQLDIGGVFQRNNMQELTYWDPSPDYCVHDVTTGSPGLKGRVCGNDGTKTRQCRLLCKKCGLKLRREQRMSPEKYIVTVCMEKKTVHPFKSLN